ncbi:MAG: DUF2779 domain-containing protein [Alphaproteobacteria bacterium]|nr:DUF2779 domain-containing protein [Alphaproteobacteria bacterium]
MKLSKSDYLLGVKCPSALWYKKYCPDLKPDKPKNESVLKSGTEVGELARKRFAGGILIDADSWTDEALQKTSDIMSGSAPVVFFRDYYETKDSEAESDNEIVYEGVVSTQTGEYCASDILRNNNDGTWDLIEVKSTTSLKNQGVGPRGGARKDSHIVDISFQRYVFEKAGIKINRCIIMTLNKEYVRHGDLDLNQLFIEHDVTNEIDELITIERNINHLREILAGPELGIAITKTKCQNTFYECPFLSHCWKNVPKYSVFNAFAAPDCDRIYNQYGTADITKISEEPKSEIKKLEIECFLNNSEHVDKNALKQFVNNLQYPLYFLDYESINSPVPLFDNSHPYQQICFQFSLHVLEKPGAELKHYEFLYDKPTDPRPELIKKLIEYCGDSGSIIVYYQPFEKTRNKEMADAFPKYADDLLAINDRIIDLIIPFKQHHLYSHKQNGSASIKKTLPAFTKLSYEGMEIANGAQASEQFLNFINGKQTPTDTQNMLTALSKYCEQDTFAMVELLRVIEEYI